MNTVLFVCLGNICRSPMAEGVFLHRLRLRGLAGAFQVDSAGTGGWHVGASPDPRTLSTLARHGVALDSRARKLRPEDGEAFRWILTMDDDNLRETHRILPAAAHPRVHPVLATTGGGEVPDPYYGGPDGFEAVYRMLVPALDLWIDRMTAAP